MEYKECKYAPWLIGEDGSIISKKTGKPRKLFKRDNLHYHVSYRKGDKTYNFYVHRLVYEHFIGEIPKGMHVHHKDHNPLNNHISNLELTTPKQNKRYAMGVGRQGDFNGEYNGMSKLNNEEAKLLIYDILEGLNNIQVGSKYNLHPRYVSLIRNKRRWKKLWEEVERATTIRKE